MTKRILVVDDEEDIRLLLKLGLEGAGFTVVEAASGTQALEVLTHTTPDVVLLDLRMPDMDGWAVIEHGREAGTLVPSTVYILSAHGGEETRIRASDEGCAGFIRKPFRLADVFGAIGLAG